MSGVEEVSGEVSGEVIDVVPEKAETVEVPPADDYDVTVTVKFVLRGPRLKDPSTQMRLLERAIWEAMPGGNIGADTFVKMPTGAHDFNVSIKAEVKEVEEAVKEVKEEGN